MDEWGDALGLVDSILTRSISEGGSSIKSSLAIRTAGVSPAGVYCLHVLRSLSQREFILASPLTLPSPLNRHECVYQNGELNPWRFGERGQGLKGIV